MELGIAFVVELAVPVLALLAAYAIGSAVERAHLRSLRLRELRWRRMPAVTFRRLPDDWRVRDAGLVTGSVVVSLDYFKRVLASLRGLFGGRVRAYESLLDRARREALLRLKESAARSGYHALLNVRLETARLASTTRQGEGTAGVEVLASATGLRLERDPSRAGA